MIKTEAPSTTKKLSILILSPHPLVHGGVSAFIETMKQHLQTCEVHSYYVGSISNQKESAFSALTRLFTAPFAVASLVHKKKIDVVHINPSLDAKSVLRDGLILLALRLSGFRKTLVYFHGWQHGMEQLLRRTPVISTLTRWLLNGVGHLFVLAPQFKQGLVAMGIHENKITFTHTMFDGAPIKAIETSIKSPERRTVLFMSRFEKTKGVYELLEAFARIAPEQKDLDLIFAGDGEEMQGLKKRVDELRLHDRVQFPGYVRDAAKAEMLTSCTVYALPTYFPEGMPVALLEAMGAGKPLLTANAGGIGHIISDPINGVVLSSVTTDTVEKGLRKLLTDDAYRHTIGGYNRDYAWKTFEAAVVTKDIEDTYKKIAQS